MRRLLLCLSSLATGGIASVREACVTKILLIHTQEEVISRFRGNSGFTEVQKKALDQNPNWGKIIKSFMRVGGTRVGYHATVS